MGRRTLLVATLAALGVLSSCVGTPIPQPPALDPPEAGRLEFDVAGSATILEGRPGTAPPGSTLWIVDLDSTTDPQVVPVAMDGSFADGPMVRDGQEIRLQVRDGDDRSRPVDVRVPIAGEIVRPTEDCLTLEPSAELRFDGAGAAILSVRNDCGAPVTLDGVDLRRPAPELAIGATPATVADGDRAEITITFIPGGAGLVEEILFVRVAAPTPDRRPVTLSGTEP